MSSVLLDPITQETKDVSECSPPSAQPHPASYDSGEEFSLAHFVHDCELIEQEDQASDRSIIEDEYLPVACRFWQVRLRSSWHSEARARLRTKSR